MTIAQLLFSNSYLSTLKNKVDKLQLTHICFDRNLSYLPEIWNLIFYPLEIWPKFKFPTYGLKSHDASISLDYFLSYLILYFMFCVFLEERDIKVEQNYIFSFVFNIKIQLIYTFSLFLLLFMSPITFFDTIHECHCTIQLIF